VTAGLHVAALPLPAAPTSVPQARAWVSHELAGLGRTDLVDAAELGVSELVTNAILHAGPPILVRLRGTLRHPRVEVYDNSTRPPAAGQDDITDDAHVMSTVGRGLAIVALYSATWGAEIVADGKFVWFEPAITPDDVDGHDGTDGTDDTGEFNLRMVPENGHPVEPPTEQVYIELRGLPVQLFERFRSWFLELRRELRLLAMAHGSDYPVAKQLSDLAVRLDSEQQHTTGLDVLDEAIAAGRERLDLTLRVPLATPATMAELHDLLERAELFCQEQRLLAVASTPQQLALQRWYLGEYVRQGAGEPPTPWSGGYRVEAAAQA
jgi:anti-sigma regulatory factor (Ser/Thr protein kinase)